MNGKANADTTINVVTAKDNVDRLTSRSSDMGLSIRPKAYRDPPVKNKTMNPVARIT
tara:strand:- start:1213 stop:1383 length:171 start_codon:yes stop_codon:yes gene_type:complete